MISNYTKLAFRTMTENLHSSSRKRLVLQIRLILISLFILSLTATSIPCYDATSPQLDGDPVHASSVIQAQSPQLDSTTTGEPGEQTEVSQGAPSPRAGMVARSQQQTDAEYQANSLKRSDKKRKEILSTDCTTKRNDILRRHQRSNGKRPHQSFDYKPAPPGMHKLRPMRENSSPNFTNETFEADNSYNEHVPRCTQDGKYEPIQCHKIGYCWCVNKFGQALKNSATLVGDKPNCTTDMYESEGNDSTLVVTGTTKHRLNRLFPFNSKNSENLSAMNQSGTESDTEVGDSDQKGHQQSRGQSEPKKTRQELSYLKPHECMLCRSTAIERASNHTDDSIWIPKCDDEDENLYAQKQCHKDRTREVCWCVDQVTGIPLRTSQQLANHVNINCTEIMKIIDIASANYHDRAAPKPHSAFFHGSSDVCDAEARVEFVSSLVKQFKEQYSEYMKFNQTNSYSEGAPLVNLHRPSDSQVSKWKFDSIDTDHDGKLGDREWSRFTQSFKLVTKIEDVHRSSRQQAKNRNSLSPLNIIKDKRLCMRDFLQFCGKFLTDEPINLSKWLSCTELPQKSSTYERIPSSHTRIRGLDTPGLAEDYAKMAAVVRSQKINPFAGILKPD